MGAQPPATDRRGALAALLPDLRAFARFLAGARGEADDLVQEALLRSLRALDTLDPGANLRAWSFAVLRNTYYEQHRSRRREAARREAEPPPAESMAPAQEAQAGLRDLARGLAGLPPLLRESLILVGAQGLSYEEAAIVCRVPVGTMKARVSRARRALGEALDVTAPETVTA